MSDPIHIIGVIDTDGNEALYVGGEWKSVDGNTIYFVDVAKHATGPCELTQVRVDFGGSKFSEWPARFEDLMPFIVDKQRI